MNMSTERATLLLARNQCARFERARDALLRCLGGVAWVTIDGQRRDIVLERGQSMRVDSNADVVVCALKGPTALAFQRA
jgi:hypothetical protein